MLQSDGYQCYCIARGRTEDWVVLGAPSWLQMRFARSLSGYKDSFGVEGMVVPVLASWETLRHPETVHPCACIHPPSGTAARQSVLFQQQQFQHPELK